MVHAAVATGHVAYLPWDWILVTSPTVCMPVELSKEHCRLESVVKRQ